MKAARWGVVLPVLLGACVDPVTPDSALPCDLDTSDHPKAEPLQALVASRAARGVPGIAIAVRTPEGVWQGAAGYADLEAGVAMTPCHVHPWASVGKTWTAALALRLVQAGQLDLDGLLADLLPSRTREGLANVDVVTVRQLMQHASGMRDFNEDLGYLTHEFDDPSSVDDPDALLDYVRGDPALFAPGEGYHYSDTAYVLLALALETLTGDRNTAMQAEVLDPLGLDHVWFPRRGDPDPPGRVNAYWELPGGRLENVSDWQAEYDIQIIGAGNVLATPGDSLTFVDGLVHGDLLASGTREDLFDWNEASQRDDGWAYGLGVARRELGSGGTWVGHTGGDIGAASVVLARDDGEASIAMVLNLGGFLGGPLNELVDDAFLEELVVTMEAP